MAVVVPGMSASVVAHVNVFSSSLTLSYQARKPGVKEQIVEMAHNCAGVHDTCQNTENRHQYRHTDIKKLSPRRITSASVAHADVALICELDEQWSFVGSKAQQH
nr:IS1 family transposase [Escherichia coli]